MASRPQINFPVSKDEHDLIEQAKLFMIIRDNKAYSRKDFVLNLCKEFIEDQNAPMGKKTA